MRGLAELLTTTGGRGLLESRGAFTDVEAFTEAVVRPSRTGLMELLGVPGDAAPVYVAHQTQADYKRSVVAKFRAARDLPLERMAPVVLWFDMDRTGSDRATTTVTWPLPGQGASVRLAPQRLRDLEPRFLQMEPSKPSEVIEQIGRWIDATARDEAERTESRRRLGSLEAALLDGPVRTLAQVNRIIAESLLRGYLAFDPPSAFVSELVEKGLLGDPVERALGSIEGFVSVANEAIEALLAAGVDPQLHPFQDDYLPLHYSCPLDGARRRLRHERHGADHFAATSCSCGAEYRFRLGASTPSLGELGQTGRWSPDVSLPVYLNDVAGGVVAGRSSALYGLVLNEVVARVLGSRPVPMLIPAELAALPAEENEGSSLLRDFLMGS